MKYRESVNIVDLDGIWGDPRLKDDPVVQTSRKIYESWTDLAKAYTSVGLLVTTGNFDDAKANIRFIQKMLRGSLANLEVLDGTIEAKLSMLREKEALDAREAETRRWIEEAENEG